MIDDLDREGVDSSHISYNEKLSTGYSVLLFLHLSGERTILTYRGASTHYNAKNFDLSNVDANWMYGNVVYGVAALRRSTRSFTKHVKGMKIMFNPGKGELKHPQNSSTPRGCRDTFG